MMNTVFEDMRITTMTLVFSLLNEADIHVASQLLPIQKMDVPEIRPSRKYKLPHCPIPGSIISINPPKGGVVRGLIERNAPPFKNAVTMCISTQRKNISLKLSNLSIQMCGASSLADGREAADHVISHLTLLQRVMTKIQKEDPSTVDTLHWVYEASRGAETSRERYDMRPCGKFRLRVRSMVDDYELTSTHSLTPPTHLHVDEEALQVARGLEDYFAYHSDYTERLKLVLLGRNVISGPLTICKHREAMVNYNYSLGFQVNRSLLKDRIDGMNGFHAHYNNALAPSVTVQLPYTPDMENDSKRNKNKIPHHTFLVYRSGSVTQSGPGGEIMKEAYYLFISTIRTLYNDIVYTHVPYENMEQ